MAARTKGIPQSLKKNGAFERKTDASQKMAKPPHNKLNGIKRMSCLRKQTPVRGCPDQISFSPAESSCWKRLGGFSSIVLTGLVDRLFDGGDDAALGGERTARDARAGGGGMAAPTELATNIADVHPGALGAEADARYLRFDLLEDAGDDDRFDGANMIN